MLMRLRPSAATLRCTRQLQHQRAFGAIEDRTSYRSLDPNAGKGFKPTPNLGTNLALQAVLFDYDVLAMVHDHDEEEYQAQKKAYQRKTGLGEHTIRRVDELLSHKDASMLLKQEMRDELKRRGLDSDGKPWVLQQRLQEVFDKEKALEVLGLPAEQLGIAGGGNKAQKTGGKPEDEPVGGVRAKYMAKLKEKKQRAFARQQGVAGQGGGQGAEMFEGEPGSQWSQNKGANEMLRYLTSRGMRVGLVMPPKSEKQISGEAFEHFAGGFDADFTPILSAEQAQSMLDKPSDPAPLDWAAKQLNLAPPKVLFVTTQAKQLKTARDAGMFSCHFTKKNARKPDSRPSYSVLTLTEMRGVVEELNGVSWAA